MNIKEALIACSIYYGIHRKSQQQKGLDISRSAVILAWFSAQYELFDRSTKMIADQILQSAGKTRTSLRGVKVTIPEYLFDAWWFSVLTDKDKNGVSLYTPIDPVDVDADFIEGIIKAL